MDALLKTYQDAVHMSCQKSCREPGRGIAFVDDGWNMDYSPIPTITLTPGEGIAVGNETGKELFFTVPNPVN